MVVLTFGILGVIASVVLISCIIEYVEKLSVWWKIWRNILVVWRIGCGKTSLVQWIAVSNLFGEFKKAEWVSEINFSASREAQIPSCFNSYLEFHYLSRFDDHLDHIKRVSDNNDNSNFTFETENVFGQ